MKNFKRLGLLFVCLSIFSTGCKEPFEPEISSFDHNILVVEGYIEVGGGESSITLGRTRPVYDSISLSPVTEAGVLIESENGTSWQLFQQTEGTYTLVDDLPENLNYRLRISNNGNEYLSEWITPIITPEISEVTFEKKEGDVSIYASTVGNERARYFLWEFEETWIYRAAYRAGYRYDATSKEMIPLREDELTYKCWQSNNSNRIILASSESYQNDFIYQKELLEIESFSEKLGERYSVNVKQKAIDKEAFVFWEAIRKNSDDIGGIFSPLPSLIGSNIYNVNDPGEPVIGYLSAGKSAEKRVYINRREVDPWRAVISDYNSCTLDTVLVKDYQFNFSTGFYFPVSPYCEELSCPGFFASTVNCVDCTVRGGFLEKPDFWED